MASRSKKSHHELRHVKKVSGASQLCRLYQLLKLFNTRKHFEKTPSSERNTVTQTSVCEKYSSIQIWIDLHLGLDHVQNLIACTVCQGVPIPNNL